MPRILSSEVDEHCSHSDPATAFSFPLLNNQTAETFFEQSYENRVCWNRRSFSTASEEELRSPAPTWRNERQRGRRSRPLRRRRWPVWKIRDDIVTAAMPKSYSLPGSTSDICPHLFTLLMSLIQFARQRFDFLLRRSPRTIRVQLWTTMIKPPTWMVRVA